MRLAKTKRHFMLKIFLKYTYIAFENNAFSKIKIISGKIVSRQTFRKILRIFENWATGDRFPINPKTILARIYP